jgi:uncharacterized protein involved in response to NO
MHAVFNLGFRTFYPLGAMMGVVALAYWLHAFAGGATPESYLQGITWHSHEMLFGFLAAVMTGFLFTAVRNWSGLTTPAGAALAMVALLWLAARVLLFTGPLVLAVAVDLAFLPVIAFAIAAPILRSRNRRNYKVVGIVAALAVLHGLFHLALAGEIPVMLVRGSMFAAIDLVAVMFALIGGRVIPAFTRNAIPGANPRHVPWVEFTAFVSLGLIVVLDLGTAWLPSPGWGPTLLFAVAGAAHLLRLVLWQPQVTFNNPLLWMLPIAYAWLPVGLFLGSLSSMSVVSPSAWIHALTIGALSSMMMAMMMRSSLGHTGRPLVANGADITAFLLLQFAAMTRVVAASIGDYRSMVILSGVLWILAFVLFLARYLPMLMRPRADGKPG